MQKTWLSLTQSRKGAKEVREGVICCCLGLVGEEAKGFEGVGYKAFCSIN